MMGDTTLISWCDSTFNPWIGCTKVSPGCVHCYAERDNKRYSWVSGWGVGAERRRTSAANWKKPVQWAKEASASGKLRRVFCASLADVFDAEVDQSWRDDLWGLIDKTGEIGGLEWLLLTKRPENIPGMIAPRWKMNHPDYVRVGVTAENQDYWNRRVALMLKNWHGKNFVSVEPMLGEVKVTTDVDHVIVGCESGPGSRSMEDAWVDSILLDCEKNSIPVFLKQVTKAGRIIKEPYWRGKQYLQFP